MPIVFGLSPVSTTSSLRRARVAMCDCSIVLAQESAPRPRRVKSSRALAIFQTVVSQVHGRRSAREPLTPGRREARRRRAGPAAARPAAGDRLAAGEVQRRETPRAGLVRVGAGAGARAQAGSGGRRQYRAAGLGRGRQARPDLRARQQRPRRLVELHRAVPRRPLSRRGDLAIGHGRQRLARDLHLRRLRERDLGMREGRRALRGGGKADLHRPLVRRLAGVLLGRHAPGADARGGAGRHRLRGPADQASRRSSGPRRPSAPARTSTAVRRAAPSPTEFTRRRKRR